MLAEGSVDVRLISTTATSLSLEPGDDVRVQSERDLLLDRPIEDPALGVGPVEESGASVLSIWSSGRASNALICS